MSKDWTGNNKSVFTCNGASNHSEGKRELWDYYATERKALEKLLNLKQIDFNKNIWEPACGELHLSNVLEEYGFNVRNSDIIDRLNNGKIEELDFLTYQGKWSGDIITNPPYKCFSSDTECYTKYGWKNWEKLKSDDEILSINPHTQEIEWSGINEIIHYNIDEDVYNFKKSHMDILCTKGHRMFAYGTNKKIQQKDNDLILSQDIRRGHYIPRTGYCWNGQSKDYFTLPAINGYSFAQPVYKKEIQIPMTDWLRFFGMWLADGYCRHTQNSFGDQRKTVGIKQMECNADVIRNILSKLPFDYKEYLDRNRKNPCINFEIHNEQLWSYLKRFGKSSDKYIPVEIKDLSTKQLNIFLDSYFSGDGSEYKDTIKKNVIGRTYRTISKRLAEDLQEIIFKLGYLSHIVSGGKYEANGENKEVYMINYSPQSIYNKIFYPSAKQSIKHYTGTVWCVNLKKNGVFLLRRNGKEFISGNCAKQFVEKALDIVDDGCKIAMFLKLTFLESKARRELFDKYPPKVLYVSSSRLQCAKNGDFETYNKGTGTAVAYGWYIWEKGFKGEPVIRWFN